MANSDALHSQDLAEDLASATNEIESMTTEELQGFLDRVHKDGLSQFGRYPKLIRLVETILSERRISLEEHFVPADAPYTSPEEEVSTSHNKDRAEESTAITEEFEAMTTKELEDFLESIRKDGLSEAAGFPKMAHLAEAILDKRRAARDEQFIPADAPYTSPNDTVQLPSSKIVLGLAGALVLAGMVFVISRPSGNPGSSESMKSDNVSTVQETSLPSDELSKTSAAGSEVFEVDYFGGGIYDAYDKELKITYKAGTSLPASAVTLYVCNEVGGYLGTISLEKQSNITDPVLAARRWKSKGEKALLPDTYRVTVVATDESGGTAKASYWYVPTGEIPEELSGVPAPACN